MTNGVEDQILPPERQRKGGLEEKAKTRLNSTEENESLLEGDNRPVEGGDVIAHNSINSDAISEHGLKPGPEDKESIAAEAKAFEIWWE